MNGYDTAIAEAVKAMRKYSPVHTNDLLCQKVAVLYKPGVAESKDIAGALGKIVQQIRQIIESIVGIKR